MIRATIGGHYGQIPKLQKMALENKFAAFALPMGSISRMIRATSIGSPNYMSSIGLNTFVDPENGSGGKINQKAVEYGGKTLSFFYVYFLF